MDGAGGGEKSVAGVGGGRACLQHAKQTQYGLARCQFSERPHSSDVGQSKSVLTWVQTATGTWKSRSCREKKLLQEGGNGTGGGDG